MQCYQNLKKLLFMVFYLILITCLKNLSFMIAFFNFDYIFIKIYTHVNILFNSDYMGIYAFKM